jgi:hypothetical protein
MLAVGRIVLPYRLWIGRRSQNRCSAILPSADA